MSKTVVILSAEQNAKTYRYVVKAHAFINWDDVLGNCLWISEFERYKDDGTIENIVKLADNKEWSSVWKEGKKFKIVKPSKIEQLAESAVKSYMNTLGEENICAVVANGKPNVILNEVSTIINTDDYDSMDFRRAIMFGNKYNTIVTDFKNYKIKVIPCNDSYHFYNMENYIDDCSFDIYKDTTIVEKRNIQTGLGMAQQLPTNSVYDGELDNLYNGGNKKMKKLINGLSVDGACDIALSNLDVDDKKIDENITNINKVSDAWEVYKKSWKKFNKEYLEKDFFETIAYLKKNGIFNKKAIDVINGWMDDIETIFYSDKEPNEMKLNFGFGGNDIFELKENKIMNKRLEEKRGNTEDEKLALAQFKDVDVDEIEDGYTDHVYEVDGEEYWVSDYDTAYDEAVEESEALFDDLGLESVTEETQEYFLENEEYCSYPWKDDMHESNLAYAQDIDSENGDDGYATRLVSEAIERKVIKDKDCFENEDGELDYEDKDELAEMLADSMDKGYDSMSEYFESIYGRNWAREMADTLKNYMDYEECAKYCVDIDGVANTLASYDLKENEEKVNGVDYYIYRRN